MRPKTLLILALAVLVLGAFIWLYEWDLPGSEERAEQAKKVLGGLESGDVDGLDIAWGDQHVRLEKRSAPTAGEGAAETADEGETGADETSGAETGDEKASGAEKRWWLVEPSETRADPDEVNRLVATLVGLEKRRTLDDPDRAAMGLEPPAATVTLTTEDGERVLQVGNEVPVSKDRIVALAGGSDAFEVAGGMWDDLTRDPGEWRDRRIVRAEQNDVTRAELTGADGAPPVVLVHDGESYRIEAPFEDRADLEMVRGFFNRLTNLRAQSFVDDPEKVKDPEALQLDPPQGVVTARLKGDGRVRVELGGVEDEKENRRYGRVGDQVFIFVDRDLEEDVERPAADWRSHAWTDLRSFRIDEVRVKDANGTFELERSAGDWLRGKDRIAYGPVGDLLDAVTEAKADRLLTPEEAKAEGWSLDQPTHTVSLMIEKHSETEEPGDETKGDETSKEEETAAEEAAKKEPAPAEVLTLYPPVEGGVPARASDRKDVVLLLPADRLKTLDDALAAIRDAEPIPEEPEADKTSDDEGDPLDITEEVGN
jgi:hypothetical protein